MSDVRTQDKLIAALRKHDPAKVKVWLGDEHRIVAIGKKRARWQVAVEAIEAAPWSRLELLDKAGDTLAYVDNDQEPGELEQLGVTQGGAQAQQTERLLAIMLRGQREVLAMRDKEVAIVMGAVGQVVKELTSALHALNTMHGEQMQLAMEAAEHQATLHSKDWVEQATELAQAAPQLAPVVQLLMQAMGKKRPIAPAKPNGANGASKVTPPG